MNTQHLLNAQKGDWGKGSAARERISSIKGSGGEDEHAGHA